MKRTTSLSPSPEARKRKRSVFQKSERRRREKDVRALEKGMFMSNGIKTINCIKEMREFGAYQLTCLVIDVVEKIDKNGKAYCNLTVCDKEQCTISAPKFGSTKRELEELVGCLVEATIEKGEYKGNDSYKFKSFAEGYGSKADYLPTAPLDVDEMYRWITDTLNDMSRVDPRSRKPGQGYIAKITADIYQDNKTDITTRGAGARIHHAYLGGLIYHTYRMCRHALSVCDVYGELLDKEMLFCAAALHDIGKLHELETSDLGSTTYTVEGNLFGHAMLGIEMIDKAAMRDTSYADENDRKACAERLMVLKHCIASHHGNREYGAIALPAVPEAEALHTIDLLDSRMDIFESEYAKMDPGESGSQIVQGLGYRVYRTTWSRYPKYSEEARIDDELMW